MRKLSPSPTHFQVKPPIPHFPSSSNTDSACRENVNNDNRPQSRLHLFRFPPDVRLMVYETSFPRRVLMFHPEGWAACPNLGMRPLPARAIAHTCREAYYFARQLYYRILYESLDLSLYDRYEVQSISRDRRSAPSSSYTWLNSDRDALLIDIFEAEHRGVIIEHASSLCRLDRGIYNSTRYLKGTWADHRCVAFSNLIRSLRRFTTVTKTIIVLRGYTDDVSFEGHLLLYCFRENFPLLQRKCFIT